MIITVVGAGGKTTVCKTLGEALTRMGQTVLLTTTTHILPPPGVPLTVGGIHSVAPAAPLTAAAKETSADGKLKGFSGEEIDALSKKGLFDAVIVEADGAKGLPLKAPEAWEPVYPQDTSLAIGVIGLSSLGQPLSDETVHRSALFSQITGAAAGDRIGFIHLLALAVHPDGLFKAAPRNAVKIVFLNKADVLKNPREEARAFMEKSGVPVFLTSRDMKWADAFIQTYIFKEGGKANE
jgi:probable selenium-dependent hydroxylase accessory protein YqeC